MLPPIGAQGLNLGFRDAAALADCVAAAMKRGGDPGGDEVLEAYDRARKLDVLTPHARHRSLQPVAALRLPAVEGRPRPRLATGLTALPPLRRFVMQVGMVPPTELPSLMRPAAR